MKRNFLIRVQLAFDSVSRMNWLWFEIHVAKRDSIAAALSLSASRKRNQNIKRRENLPCASILDHIGDVSASLLHRHLCCDCDWSTSIRILRTGDGAENDRFDTKRHTRTWKRSVDGSNPIPFKSDDHWKKTKQRRAAEEIPLKVRDFFRHHFCAFQPHSHCFPLYIIHKLERNRPNAEKKNTSSVCYDFVCAGRRCKRNQLSAAMAMGK